jgi:hypothetical protein
MYWSAGIKIADFDTGIGAGELDVDAAISGVACSPRSKCLMIMLLVTLKNVFGEKAPAAQLDRSVDLQSSPANEKAQLGMRVRCAIITGNLSLSIQQKLAEIERSS